MKKISEQAAIGNDATQEPRVALVHDFLLYPGGAERVLQEFMMLYPQAPIYTLLYDITCMGEMMSGREVRTSFLQKWPAFFRRRHRFLLPFYGPAVEAMDLRNFDLVISSSGAWTKGLVTRLDTKHIAYVHSPMRYVWDENERYVRRISPKIGFFARHILSYLRVWDHQAAQRPDALIANSRYTQKRIEKYYRRDSKVLYPPVRVPTDVQNAHVIPRDERSGFVIVSRLSTYKNVALAIEVCNKLQIDLTVIGTGKDRGALEDMAGEHITFTGWLDEQAKWTYLRSARALLFPCEDDFGIVCVEALAAGTPVIALGRGGAPEIVRDSIDGILFDAPVIEVIADGVRRFLEKEQSFDYDELRQRSRIFSEHAFITQWEKSDAK